jgi:site-specific recombinase XerC
VRGGAVNEPIFIALDGRSYGKRLAGRSVARVVDWVATDAGVSKHLSPHRIIVRLLRFWMRVGGMCGRRSG